MTGKILAAACAAIFATATQAQTQPWLTPDRYNAVAVVTPGDPSDTVKDAAQDFARYWESVTGYAVPVNGGEDAAATVRIGLLAEDDPLFDALGIAELGTQGIRLFTTDSGELILTGGGDLGVQYAVYEFIERYLGVRWLAIDYTHIPEAPDAIPAIDYRYEPTFEYRWTTYLFKEEGIQDFVRAHRMLSGPSFSAHTFYNFIPPEEYFESHPEYFSEVNGERVAPHDFDWRDHATWGANHDRLAQLCMTNPGVIRIIADKIIERIDDDPDTRMHHVSQMDWQNWCECQTCSAIDEAEESHMGATLYGLNRIATRVAEAHPGYGIETLAYQYTRKPPKSMKPVENLAIKLCSIECDFFRPLDDPDSELNQVFADDIRRWAKIAPRLHVWDYTTNFRNFQSPLPNFHILDDNIRFFANHNVKGMFPQGSYDRAAEFAHLKAYVLAKLLWKPESDAEIHMNEFIDLYYREAGPHVKRYILLLTETARESGLALTCFDPGVWQDAAFVEEARAIMADAYEAADSGEIRDRLAPLKATVEHAALVCPPEVEVNGDTFTLTRPESMELEPYITMVEDLGAKTVVDFFPMERFREQVGGKTPPRKIAAKLVVLENDSHFVWIAPELEGSILRWRQKDLGVELLRGYEHYGAHPGTWQDWENDLGSGEGPLAGSYDIVEQTETTLVLRASLGNGLELQRRMELNGDRIAMTWTYTNRAGQTQPVEGKCHPEFWVQGQHIPEFWAKSEEGWTELTNTTTRDLAAYGRKLAPNDYNQWAFHVPAADLTVWNVFDPDDLQHLLMFYTSHPADEHANLELIPKAKSLAPGESFTYGAEYWANRKHPAR